jgi:hypothetical protein
MDFDCGRNQSMAECFEQSPIASLVGVGQSGAGYLAANPNVVELGALRIEASHQISQSFPTSQLGIRDTQKLGPGREVSDSVVRCISIDEMLEMTEGNEVQQLREYRPATIHDAAPFAKITCKDTVEIPVAISNRRNLGSRQNSRHYKVSIR